MLLSFLLGCTPPCAEGTPLPPTPHRLQVSWTAQTAQRGWVEYHTPQHTMDVQTHRDGDLHRAVLSMLTAYTELSWTAFEGDLAICTGRQPLQGLPSELPAWTADGQASWDWLLAAVMGAFPAVAIVDGDGAYRWHHLEPIERGEPLFATLVNDEIWFNVVDPRREEDLGAVMAVDDSGTLLFEQPAPGMHHGFTPLPAGGFAYLATDVRQWQDPNTLEHDDVVGDAIWEVGPDGERTEVFNIWDVASPTPHENWNSTFYPQGRDWSHGNALRFSPQRSSYLVSFGYLERIMEIDRSTGDVLLDISPETWTIQGHVYDFPHSPMWVDDEHLLLFSYAEGAAGAVEYHVDRERRTLTTTWSHTRPEPLLPFLGSAHRLDSGHTLINYGASGMLEEVTPDGVVIWSLSSPFGSWLGEGQALP